MSQWQKLTARWRGRLSNSVDDTRSYFAGGWLLRGFLLVLLVYLLIAGLVGWYWSQEPAMFPVQEQAQRAAEAKQQPLVNGFTTVETLKTLASTLVDKPGGYIHNDIAPPGLWLDNISNWEYGVLIQVRDMTRALRKDFSRSQSQSSEDMDLAKAEPLFSLENSWAFPASEDEFRRGIAALDRYQTRLSNEGKSQAYFYTRADNLNNWLADASTRLGSLSQRLSASVGQVRLEGGEGSSAEGVQEEIYETPWLEIDDVFYEARGQAWALLHLLRAIEVDFADVLAKKNATVSLRQIIRELEASQDTLWSPVVLNGSGYGLLANHSLVMANYLSRANAALIDLRQLLSQG